MSLFKSPPSADCLHPDTNRINEQQLQDNMFSEIWNGGFILGLSGKLTQLGVSFFNPVYASAAGSFWQFASLGAIAAPLVILPQLMARIVIDNSDYLNDRPNLKGILQNSIDLILGLAAVTAAALLLSIPPLGATAVCAVVLPTITSVIGMIMHTCNAIVQAVSPMNNQVNQVDVNHMAPNEIDANNVEAQFFAGLQVG